MVLIDGALKTRDELENILSKNPGLIFIKFEADWCGPCKKIAPVVDKYFNSFGENIWCIKVDIDESVQLYALFKRFKMLNGIPALFCYTPEEEEMFPKISCNTSDLNEVEAFFKESLSFL
jgi:thiol-disulfide isomerase/thioredoxin